MFWVNDAWPIISTLQTNDVSSTRLHRFCSNLPFNELITSYKTTVMFSVSSVTFQWLGDVFIDVSVWNHELQIHSVHRPTACSVNHVLNTTWRQPVGKKNSEPDSLSCHNLWSHSVIGLPHSTSSWVDWASAAPQLSSRLCVREAARINNTFHAFWCQRHAAALTVRLKRRESAFWNFHVWHLRETEDDFLLVFIERTMKTCRPLWRC